MIRIKVYKASHLMIGALVAVLVIVLAVIVVRFALNNPATPTGSIRGDGSKTVTNWVAANAAIPSLSGNVREVVFDAPETADRSENEHTDEAFIVEVVPPAQAKVEAPAKSARDTRVLIYHTHTHEAYRQVENDPYVETEMWRTKDQTHSVVAVGEALAKQLKDKGFYVVHDTTDNEGTNINTAYSRSLETIEKYGPDAFDLYIDLHRDAYGESSHQGVVSVFAQNKSAAQLMILLGNGEGFDIKPDFAGNYRFAEALTDRINALSPNLCREVLVKNNRYNQHVGKEALLIEVGHNLNTLEEALNAIPTLAEALYEILTGGRAN